MTAQADQLEKSARQALTDAENHFRLALEAVAIEGGKPMVASNAGVQSAPQNTPVPKSGFELGTSPGPTTAMPPDLPKRVDEAPSIDSVPAEHYHFATGTFLSRIECTNSSNVATSTSIFIAIHTSEGPRFLDIGSDYLPYQRVCRRTDVGIRNKYRNHNCTFRTVRS